MVAINQTANLTNISSGDFLGMGKDFGSKSFSIIEGIGLSVSETTGWSLAFSLIAVSLVAGVLLQRTVLAKHSITKIVIVILIILYVLSKGLIVV